MNKTEYVESLTATMGYAAMGVKSDENKLLEAIDEMNSKPLDQRIRDAGGTVFEDADNVPRYTLAALNECGTKARLQKREVGIAKLSKEEQDHFSSIYRKSEQVTGFLTIEQAKEQLASATPGLMIQDCGIVMNGDGVAYFLADDSTWGHGVLPTKFVPMSLRIPRTAAAVDDFLATYGRGEKHLKTTDELVAYLNESYPNG